MRRNFYAQLTWFIALSSSQAALLEIIWVPRLSPERLINDGYYFAAEQCAPALCGPSVIVSTLLQKLPLPGRIRGRGRHLKSRDQSPHPDTRLSPPPVTHREVRLSEEGAYSLRSPEQSVCVMLVYNQHHTCKYFYLICLVTLYTSKCSSHLFSCTADSTPCS